MTRSPSNYVNTFKIIILGSQNYFFSPIQIQNSAFDSQRKSIKWESLMPEREEFWLGRGVRGRAGLEVSRSGLRRMSELGFLR